MRTTKTAARAFFGLLVAAALGFGATEVRASAGQSCTINYTQGMVGYCADQASCDSKCESTYRNGMGGICMFNNCCTCAI